MEILGDKAKRKRAELIESNYERMFVVEAYATVKNGEAQYRFYIELHAAARILEGGRQLIRSLAEMVPKKIENAIESAMLPGSPATASGPVEEPVP